MIIEIDSKTRIQVHEDHFALMRPGKRDGKPTWVEEKWFSSLENCIQFISQRRAAKNKSVVSLDKFLVAYRRILAEIRDIRSKNIL